MNAFVVSGLTRRRAALAGDLEKCHDSLRRTVLDLENLGPTTLQFERDFRIETIIPNAFRRLSWPECSCRRRRHRKKPGGFQ